MKQLIHYVYGSWIPANDEKYNRFGYEFHCFESGNVYFFLPILEKEKWKPRQPVYSIEIWTKYIDEHIQMNLTTTGLAQQFHYSETHFKRIFRYYYKMSVSDYIRKRRLQAGELHPQGLLLYSYGPRNRWLP
jgi:YesN/AraC family two-component response regulator